jgi:hypothetical protein
MGRISKVEKERALAGANANGLTTYMSCEPLDGAELMSEESNSNSNNNNNNNNSHLTNLITMQNLIKSSTTRLIASNPEPATLIAHTSYAAVCLNSRMETNLAVLNLVRDKCYQLYMDRYFGRGGARELAQRMATKKIIAGGLVVTNSTTRQLTFKEAWPLINEYSTTRFHEFYEYALVLPGVDKVSKTDLGALLSNIYLVMSGFMHTRMIVDGESFIMMPGGVQCDRRMIETMMGVEVSDRVFELHAKLAHWRVTDHEIALLVPVILTMETGRNSFFI